MAQGDQSFDSACRLEPGARSACVTQPEIDRACKFEAHTRYDDSVRAQTAAGLQVLDVNHVSAPWATTNTMHFPPDLRDIYGFYRVLAKRWQGEVAAIETPWNEADIKGLADIPTAKWPPCEKQPGWASKPATRI